MPKISSGSLIHIKFNAEEALESRRDLLASQVILLKILKRVNTYRILRAKEFELKLILSKKIKEAKVGISNLEKALPKLKIPKILDREEHEEKSAHKAETHDLSIEEQLREIQRKLDELQRR